MRPASTLATAKSGTGFKMALSPQGKVRHTVGQISTFPSPLLLLLVLLLFLLI